MTEEILVAELAGRLDKILSESLAMSRSQVQQLLKKDLILVNGQVAKANHKVKIGDQIQVLPMPVDPEQEQKVLPEAIDLSIVYEDEDLLVVDKPSGMVVHPSFGHDSGTLVNALLYHIEHLSTGSSHVRPGIVHRIDKDTSGLLVVAKTNESHQVLADQLKEHSMTREYLALVHGVIKHETGTIDAPLARDKQNRLKWSVQEEGKRAVTHFKVLERFKDHTLLSVELETGRTHQIRAHMAYIGYPLVGEPIYSQQVDDKSQGQYLHARSLGFRHPRTGENLLFTSELPTYFKDYLDGLRISH